MKKWLKRIAWLFVVLLLTAAGTAVWLLETESGARFAFDRVRAALADAISAEELHGGLSSPLELRGLRYHDAASGVDVHVDKARIEYALAGLWSKSLKIASLDVDGVRIALTTVPAAPPTSPQPLASLLTPPLDVLLDRARIGRIALSQDGKPVVALDRFEAAATWTRKALTIVNLNVLAPEGKIDLAGSLTSYTDLRSTAKATFDWRVGERRITGTLDAGNDGTSASASVKLQQPLVASLDARVDPRTEAMPWSAELHVPHFDPRTLAGGDSLQAVALELKGGGDRAHARLTADIELNGHRLALDPLQLALSGQTLTLEDIRLRSPDAAGQLSATGTVRLDAHPVAADLAVAWEGVAIPADVAGRDIATHGHLAAHGSAEKGSVTGALSLDSAGRRAEMEFDFDAGATSVALRRLELVQPGGGLHASGTIEMQPALAWNLAATAHALDPGAFAPDWPGAVDFDLSTNGQMETGGPTGQIALTKLGGKLRQRPLAGSADLRFAPPLVVEGSLELKSGGSSIAVQGKHGAHTHVDLAVASLNDWLPRVSGSLNGRADLDGAWPHMDLRGDFDAKELAAGDLRMSSLKINVQAKDAGTGAGALTLDAHSLSVADHSFDSVKIDIHGNRDTHMLTVQARGPEIDGDLGIDGALRGENWSGTLSTLTLTPKLDVQAQWRLAHPVELGYAKGDFHLGETCLTAQPSSLCVAAAQTAGSLETKFSIEHLALATIAHLAEPDESTHIAGEIAGQGEVKRTPDGTLSGHANIHSTSGSIAEADSPSSPLFGYDGLDVNAAFAPAQSTITVRAGLKDGGHVDGHIELGAPAADGMPISGTIATTFRNLGALDLFSGQTSSTKGTLDTTLKFSGTTAAPAIVGDLTLADFATELPTLGLKLHEGRATAHSDGKDFRLDARVGSADGTLSVTGNGSFDSNAPVAIKISGDAFLAADIPGAKVHISPDLTLERTEKQLTLNGTVTVPKADIDLAKLPGGGMTKVSPDVVVVDAESPPLPGSLPFSADVQVKIGAGEKLAMDLRQGQEVHLVGFGLNGYLSGQIGVQERPGRATTARGQIVVDGTYKAYGQDLTIEQGRLLFAGTPLDNPGLSVRATRSFTNPDVTVGIQVRGTARAPVLSTFSDPAMSQSDALSYLVAGHPLSQLKSGEGDAVGSAARALGTAGGDLIAKNVGSRMGLDDVGVTDSSAIGGAALTVGKYLSPRLYMSYGVGLFTPGEVVTLRYRLTRLFNIEVENGTLSSRAGINYKIEK